MSRTVNTGARLDPDLIDEIEALRARELQKPSFAHMVRLLLREALAARREKTDDNAKGVNR